MRYVNAFPGGRSRDVTSHQPPALALEVAPRYIHIMYLSLPLPVQLTHYFKYILCSARKRTRLSSGTYTYTYTYILLSLLLMKLTS